MIAWQEIFSKIDPDGTLINEGSVTAANLRDFKRFIDAAHVRHCLVKPYQELKNYPLVESRELLPSFDNDMYEYDELPGLSLVAFSRPLDYFSEIFQFDKLHSVNTSANCCPLENQVTGQNIETLASRLPKRTQEKLRLEFHDRDVTLLDHYHDLLPYLLEMDRAQVFALDADNLFHLAGVFASFPSDIDSELKRFGIRIGKFVYGDSATYERNRMFVYQFLMELYGFPIVSERRTSSALFARKLHKSGENFLLRVLGQSDRTITTYISDGERRRYPRVEKIALVAVEPDQKDAINTITDKGFFLDREKRVVIMRVTYRQHRYDPGNLRQDRALSVASQEILHPLTGQALTGLNIIKDAGNLFLRLNDIVRGEYYGRVVYKRAEIVENTDTDEKRLKFIYSWLTKHHRRMLTYGDDFFANVTRALTAYLRDPEKTEIFDSMRELHGEVCGRLSYLRQARRVRVLQDLSKRLFKGRRVNYLVTLKEAVSELNDLQFEIVNFFPDLVEATVQAAEAILHDRYLSRHYLNTPENKLTRNGRDIRKYYGRLVALLDSVKAVRKSRLTSENRDNAEAGVA